jgi:lysophospholipase L1-like esterase
MEKKRDWWSREFRVMLAAGDSLTAGAWASCRERRWTNLLAGMINDLQRVPVQLVNVGIGANVISTRSPAYSASQKPALDERLEKHVLSNSANGNPIIPDLLLISYGMNDMSSLTPIPLFREELAKIVHRVRERFQPLIVLLGTYYCTDYTVGAPAFGRGSSELSKQYNEAIRDSASQLNCLFVDLLSAYGAADWMIHHDGIHSNDLGHRIVANKVFEVLASNCSGLAIETQSMEKSIAQWRDEAILHPGQ